MANPWEPEIEITHRLARDCMRFELACLTRLPHRLPLAVPEPAFLGAPRADYPFPFSGYRKLEGRTACGASLDDDTRAASAAKLGEFLRALHDLEVTHELAEAMPVDLIRRADLYARHLLVDDSGRVCGVIDWGDAHLGDPALDLSIQFAFLPPEARPAFEAAYGELDADTRRRARFRALFSGTMLVHYGASSGDEALVEAGRWALERA
jgi:aminoglycoside phosphotransferase (APT) family kinase protein